MKNTGERAVARVVVATGVSSVVAQLFVIRECLTQFEGNEFVIALTLFNWLVLGGLGTLWARRAVRPPRGATPTGLGWMSLVLAAMPTAQIYGIRMLRDAMFGYGVSVGFYHTLAYTFLTMAPYSLMVGFVLPYSLFVLRTDRPACPGAVVYVLDNVGDVLGGAFFAFVLAYLATPLQGVCAAGLPLVVCAILVFPRTRCRWAMVVAGVVPVLGVMAAGVALERASLAPAVGSLVDYLETPYGRITVHRNGDQVTVFEDGVPALFSQNRVDAEEAVHYPMAQVDHPRRVLLISARSGVTAELAKHRPRAVDHVERNPAVTRTALRFGLMEPVPGMRTVHGDGRTFLARSSDRYDAIIVNLPEPATFQTNRFFTDGFFALAKGRLRPEGVLSFSVQGFENYLAEPQRQKISSLYNTAGGHFSHVLMLPGQRVYFVCGNRPLNTDIPGLLARKGVDTRYISRYYLGDMTAERLHQLQGLVDPETPRNTDRSPRLMRIVFSQWFAKHGASPVVFMALVAGLGAAYLARLSRAAFVLFSTGFVTMGCEILVIFAVQIYFGYVYLQIGLIVTVFLAGLMPGAWIGQRLRQGRRRALAVTDLMLMVLCVVYILAVLKPGAPLIAYLVFGFWVSLVCGCQFPLVLERMGDDDRAASQAFSADLMGAASGTLVTSVVLVPFLGVVGAAAGLILLKLLSLVVVRHETLGQA